ncbi:hypothetical protein CONPUDRAFT_162540 [Coniophora puteana RWD-64-598 SS2]|uniref:Uncharacterized protein n=1 Tax=Coniophora puteana (strain RWD-64-598) TaxID=741705 RepID=A0A5M3N1S4_CONPW|nr:uncharacterized protein CONPUDRAFT_162540 [Coniophora puteana RWD-64-598 SS2]EIW85328.1 hypothetical protein CONPUDRAFT_162540 [Coniophora puteana RWD-64-598 SS2]
MSAAPSNSLGLDFDRLQVKDDSTAPAEEQQEPVDDQPDTPSGSAAPDDAQDKDREPREPKDRKKPYVNPDRVKTGGAQRDKLTEEELTERMQRIKEQNEKIKQRRLDVQADEDAFKKTQEVERVKQANTRKVQDKVDKTREQNARRKMDKAQSREWDSGKSAPDWKKKSSEGQNTEEGTEASQHTVSSRGGGRQLRGGFRAVPGRGRGRGRGQVTNASPTSAVNESSAPAEDKGSGDTDGVADATAATDEPVIASDETGLAL